jgi:hypothetical protein
VSKKKKTPKAKSVTTKKTPVKSYPILRVDWKDHWSGNNQWNNPDGIKHRPMHCVSVGVLVKEDKEGLSLAQNMTSNEVVADTVYILKNCITHRTKLGSVSYDKE